MAWETGTYACGHEGREQFYGKHKDREWAVQKHFEKVCPECWKAECERKSKEAAEKNKALALPALKGSPKQIAWAESIRARFTNIEGYTTSLRNDSAKWWIDNRDTMELYADSVALSKALDRAEKLAKEGKLAKPEAPMSLAGLSHADALKVVEDYIDSHRIIAA